jgi:hypothetical protein
MATGSLDANGIWIYGEDDSEATFSALLNKLGDSTSDEVGTLKTSPTISGNVRLTNTTDASLTSTNHAFQIGASNANNLRLDDNEIMAVNNGTAGTLTVQGDGGNITLGNSASTTTISGRISGTHYPFAVATGSATITQTTSNASVSVTFPSGRFTAAPIVSTNQPTAAGVQQKLNNRAINITSTGCTLFTSTGDGTTTASTHTVTYIAIQM